MARVPAVGTRRDADGDGRENRASDHFCPGCGARQRLVARHPWRFCHDCLARAEDCDGRRLDFFGPGFGWRYADEPALGDEACSGVVCLIGKREVLVSEARFGGAVAEPLRAGAPGLPERPGIVRLVEASGASAARRRLKPLRA